VCQLIFSIDYTPFIFRHLRHAHHHNPSNGICRPSIGFLGLLKGSSLNLVISVVILFIKKDCAISLQSKRSFFMKVRTGIGQDSHRFLPVDTSKPCIIAGLIFEDAPGFNANSDGDVVFHSICNAITSLTGVLILGGIADDLCLKDGITDSEVYLREAMKTLNKQKVTHVSLAIEAKKPKFLHRLLEMRENIARVMGLQVSEVGITATSGEGLTDFGCGEGVQAFAVVTTQED
jgi:2-C-methyl-D-erythritol 2,4-cyclodiphosphate synthase